MLESAWTEEWRRRREMERSIARAFLIAMIIAIIAALVALAYDDDRLVKDCSAAGYRVVRDQGSHICVDPRTGKTVTP